MRYRVQDIVLYDFFTANRDAQLGALMTFLDCEKRSDGTATPVTVSAFAFAEKLQTAFGLTERPTETANLILRLWARRNYFEVAGHDDLQRPFYRLGNLGKLTLLGEERSAEERARACVEARAAMHGYRASGGPPIH